jgi:Short C-terminal domain
VHVFFRPRRPLLGAAMLGGTFLAGRAAQRTAYQESEQDQRIAELEDQPSVPSSAAPPAQSSFVAQLAQLSSLKDSGALSAEEFETAKQKLLAS